MKEKKPKKEEEEEKAMSAHRLSLNTFISSVFFALSVHHYLIGG